jgi:hypothetical protein
LIEPQSVLDEVVYLVYGFVLSHFLLELLFGLAELLLFLLPPSVLVEFEVFDNFGVFFLHFQEEIAEKIE